MAILFMDKKGITSLLDDPFDNYYFFISFLRFSLYFLQQAL